MVLTKTADHLAPVNAGEQIGFTITLHNNGPGTATGAAINDPLPGGTSGTVTWSESPDSADCSIAGAAGSQLLTCGPKTLASGGEIAVHVVATTSAANCGVYNNTATFTTTNDGSGPASASESCQRPTMVLTKTADHLAPVNAGEQIGFTITLHNNGPGTATGAAINDPLPGGTSGTVTWSESPDSADCSIAGAAGSQLLTCGPKTLASGGEISVHVVATTSAANCGQYNNTATFTTTNDGTGTATASETCLRSDVLLIKTPDHQAPVNAGEQIGFTVTLLNNGLGTATGAAINDPLPGGTVGTVHWTLALSNDASCAIDGADGSQVLHCGPEFLASGAFITAHVVATTSAANCGQYNNTATFTTTNDGSGPASASETCQRPTMVLTKTADHLAPVNAGEQIGFTVTLHNNGPGTATGAAINDPLPGGTSGTVTWSESPDSADCSIAGAAGSQLLTCGPKTLASGEEIAVHVVATTSAANCGVYNNTATFTTTNDGSGPASASESCQRPNLVLSKTADHLAPVNAGEQIGFVVTLHNNGPGTATGAAINDPLPKGTVGTVDWSESPDSADCSISRCNRQRGAVLWPEDVAVGWGDLGARGRDDLGRQLRRLQQHRHLHHHQRRHGYRERAGDLPAVEPGADEDGGSSGAGERRRPDRVRGHVAQQRAGDGDRGGDQRSAA